MIFQPWMEGRAAVGRRLRYHRRLTLPILRLPTTLFPHQCFSLSLEPPEHERRYNVLTPPQLREAWSEHGGRLAALAWGSSVGVELQLLQLDDAEAPHVPLPTPPLVHHAVGGRRLRLLELLDERSGAGSRLGWLSPLEDECIDGGASAAEAALLHAEADAARALLHSAATPLELSLCTLDEELLLSVCDPRCHPRWRSQQAPPEDPAALSLWLAARLSLTTSLRSHLLACTDPLKVNRLEPVPQPLSLNPTSNPHPHANPNPNPNPNRSSGCATASTRCVCSPTRAGRSRHMPSSRWC